jgi:hypothetical protein
MTRLTTIEAMLPPKNMAINISIPKITPLTDGYTFQFKEGVNLITGLNGSGKTRIANELIKSIYIDPQHHLDPSLILIGENICRFVDSKFLKELISSSESTVHTQICETANNILISYDPLARKPIGKIIFVDRKFRFENDSLAAYSERFLLAFSLILTCRILNKQLENIPLIFDGVLGLLDRSDINFLIELIRKYIKFSVLLENPCAIDFLDYGVKKSKFSNHYKLVLKIPKERYRESMNGYLEITSIPSEEYGSKIEQF